MNTKFPDRDFRILVNCLTRADNNLKGAGDVIVVVDGYDTADRTGCVLVHSEVLGGTELLPVLSEIFDRSARSFIANQLAKDPHAVMDARAHALREASMNGVLMPQVAVSDSTPTATRSNVYMFRPNS